MKKRFIPKVKPKLAPKIYMGCESSDHEFSQLSGNWIQTSSSFGGGLKLSEPQKIFCRKCGETREV